MKRSTIFILLGIAAVVVAGGIIYFMQRAKKARKADDAAVVQETNEVLEAVTHTIPMDFAGQSNSAGVLTVPTLGAKDFAISPSFPVVTRL